MFPSQSPSSSTKRPETQNSDGSPIDGAPLARAQSTKSLAELTLERCLQSLENPGQDTRDQQRQQDVGRSILAKGPNKPRLVLMGLRRSGKSSISSVVFHKLPPSETLYLEATTKITKDSMHSFMDFDVWDFPGQVEYDSIIDFDSILSEVGALVWVIDAQDEYYDAIESLNRFIIYMQDRYPAINVEVFVHKVDGLSEDFKGDIFRDISQRVLDEMADLQYDDAPVSFYQTSIYDHSIFEAFSKVIQKLIPQLLPTLESLLNSLCSNCHIQKAYLFDVWSKIYVASDASPGDISTYETCSDYIDVVVDISEIYGWDRPPENSEADGKVEEYGNSDAESLIVMERKGNGYLYLREVNKYLALICIMGDDDPKERKALIDYNVSVFQKALNEVFQR
ncbi:MAG: hypothetical protein M1828_001624 [Chrysothrix sp. TS-e1954]|nr:MAG: hypothetical protein M1828_001624 [Chrysothrix sp. TS-e1954]